MLVQPATATDSLPHPPLYCYEEPEPQAEMEEDPLNTAWMPLARDRRLVKQILAGDERAFREVCGEALTTLYGEEGQTLLNR